MTAIRQTFDAPSYCGQSADRVLLSLIICTLDESESIGTVLREVQGALDTTSYEIIVVDDSDDDRTADIVLAYAATNPQVKLIRRAEARGLASAAIAGWDAAHGDILAIMDGDGQHDPRLLLPMLDRLQNTGADITVASRYAVEGPSGLTGRRHLISRSGTLLATLVLGIRSTDPLSGLFVMRRDWFEKARPRLSGVGFKILVDLMSSGVRTPKVVEVGTSLRERVGGVSKLDARVILELAALLFEKRTYGLVPARFSLFAAVGSSGVAVHLAALASMMATMDVPFWVAQAVATFAAMNSNFFLNNALTFRDRRLSGRTLWAGLAAFYVSCAGGALLGEAIGSAAAGSGIHWLAAGILGAFSAAIWNYAAANGGIWRDGGVLATQRRASDIIPISDATDRAKGAVS